MSRTKTGYLDSRQSGQTVSIESTEAETVIYDELNPDTGEVNFRCSSCDVNMTEKLNELSDIAVKTGNSHHSIPSDRVKISSRTTWWVTLWWTLYLGGISCLFLLGMNLVFK